jgi:hypothetical protein
VVDAVGGRPYEVVKRGLYQRWANKGSYYPERVLAPM